MPSPHPIGSDPTHASSSTSTTGSLGPVPGVLDVVLEAGLATRDEVAAAELSASLTGTPAHSILLANGTVGLRDLARALAASWRVPFADLDRTEWDPELVGRFDPERLIAEGWFPIRTDAGVTLVATAHPPTPDRQASIALAVGNEVTLAATTEWDVQNAVLATFREQIVDQASLGLWRRDAEHSARVVLTRTQQVVLAIAVFVFVASALLRPVETLAATVAVISFGFLVSVLFKFVVCLVGARLEHVDPISADDIAALDDRDLPVYTVLVPVFREAEVVGDLVRNLGALDYPADKLQILLLLEEGDTETIEAAKAANPPATITFQSVPAGHPQTKPKACNVGLYFARGEYLVIYDAEDRPDADQLKRAVIAFERGGDDMVCVQAALNYWNVDDNALTRMFTLEYSFWFDYMLPGLDALGLPIPLGGTSNHFRTSALRELGGWDPFNVTEDADLGIRASALGARVGVIRSTTFEEANNAYGNFVRQRSRWIKGYMQTTLVHLRHPVELVRTVGLKSATAFALLIGGTPLSFLFTPPLLALLAISLVWSPEEISRYMPGWVLWAGLVNLLIGNALMIYVSMMGAFRRRRHGLVPWGLLNPAYWLLHSAASYKALWQLIVKPHFWEKTTHGLSTSDTAGHDPHGAGAPSDLVGVAAGGAS